jgi:hypothetical protein
MPKKFVSRGHPNLYEINTAAWLFDLAQKGGRNMLLRDVPSEEWDSLKAQGMDYVWLMGVWNRSEAGRKLNLNDPQAFKYFQTVLPDCKDEDIIGSCYSIGSGDPDPLVGTWEDIDQAHSELNKRGMGLILDFIPNHRGIDHPWLTEHPEYFIQVSREQYLKDKQAYFPVAVKDHSVYIAHGKDPNFLAWLDTAQLNYFNPATQTAIIDHLEEIARHCDGVRCDMAMLVLKDVFQTTWGWANNDPRYLPPATEFWTNAFQRVPDLVYIAEAYWDTEWTLQQLGFDYTYDKRLYDRLQKALPHEVYLHLTAGMDFQTKLVRFIENHDEPRSAAIFQKDQLQAVATLLAGLPGMKLYFQGQFEGRQIRLPLQIRQTRPEEMDAEIKAFYERLLPIVNQSICHSGLWELMPVTPEGRDASENVIAYLWKLQGKLRLFVINLGQEPAAGIIYFQNESAVPGSYSLITRLGGTPPESNVNLVIHSGLRFVFKGYQTGIYDIEF